MEKLDEHNIQIVPPGFHLMFLPFADDFRKVKLEKDVPRGILWAISHEEKIIKFNLQNLKFSTRYFWLQFLELKKIIMLLFSFYK